MTSETRPPAILIIGGAGFVGRAILGELADDQPLFRPSSIRVLDVKPLSDDSLELPLSIEYMQGDIRNEKDVQRACEGMDIVIHLASLVDWGTHPEAEVHEINVGGTRNVIQACRNAKVKVLVYTSSLDAIFCGKPIRNADENHPYPAPFSNAYSETKAIAEGLVKDASDDTLSTVVLRPSGIYGEGDPYHLTGLVEIARKGPYFRVGNGTSQCMHIYVGNVAHGHLLAADALWNDNRTVSGEIYFLVDSPPRNFFHHLDPILERAGFRLRPGNLWIPGWFLYPIALLNEGVAFLLRPFVRINPKLSRFALTYICTDFTLNGDKAVRDFGFSPKYDTEAAIERSAAWLRRFAPDGTRLNR